MMAVVSGCNLGGHHRLTGDGRCQVHSSFYDHDLSCVGSEGNGLSFG
jgi:hypothetical protein